jgi:circadian clock protein KaiB
MPKRHASTKATSERPPGDTQNHRYELRLYVAGVTPHSQRAIKSVTEVCRRNLDGRYTLQVIDIYQQPALAKGEQIIAAPTLIKQLPPPLRKLIGSMADTEKLLVGLDLRPKVE